MKPFYFLKGRTALKYGLKYLGLKKNDKLLVPAFICDVVIEELNQLDIKPVYYLINKNFDANWSDIKKKYSKNVKGILMVNFFGKPQKINKFKKFSKKKNIYLIEDNCHGFSGLKNVKLSSDMVITSPYKIMNEINHGGILFIQDNKKKLDLKNIDRHIITIYTKIINLIKKINFLRNVNQFIFKRPDYESFTINIKKDIQNDYLLDYDSIQKISKFSYFKEKKLRITRFKAWKKQLSKFNIKPYFNYTKRDNYILWYLVAKINDHKIRKKFYDWGWKKNIHIISWPSFYRKLKNNNEIHKFSRALVLFPLNKDLNDE